MMSVSHKYRSAFDEAVAFHQHNAIENDLRELCQSLDSEDLSTSFCRSHLSSISSTPSIELTVLSGSVVNLPIGEHKVCQVWHVYSMLIMSLSLPLT